MRGIVTSNVDVIVVDLAVVVRPTLVVVMFEIPGVTNAVVLSVRVVWKVLAIVG